ncbi:MAG: hypothetical protein R3C49_25580 [Planctomycetaceae bacterium]
MRALEPAPSVSDEGFLRQVSRNRIGLIGFGLSLLQLVFHGAWLTFAAWLSAQGVAQTLPAGAWQLWTISLLMLTGGVLTMVSLFLCLVGSLHGHPRILAALGLCLSFFVGILTTFVLLMKVTA